jgi:magnesium-transporting ATPase (P-type)
MDSSETYEVSRSFCEKDLVFLGLLIVQNKLKEAASHTLKILKEKANAKVRMVTRVIL